MASKATQTTPHTLITIPPKRPIDPAHLETRRIHDENCRITEVLLETMTVEQLQTLFPGWEPRPGQYPWTNPVPWEGYLLEICQAAGCKLAELNILPLMQKVVIIRKALSAKLDGTRLEPTCSTKHAKKHREKTPPQVLKETRERQTLKFLTDDPNLTCQTISEKLGCHRSTISRLSAWQKRHLLFGGKIPSGNKYQHVIDGVFDDE